MRSHCDQAGRLWGRLDSRRFQPAHVPRLDAIITVLQPPERLAETLNERRATEPRWNPRGDRNAVARIACMANPLARIASRGRAVRWAALYEAAKFVYGHGKRMYGNLSPAERERLGQLMRKSRGRRSNLTEREQRRVWELVKKAATGS
jgi:hypothetical protein